MKQNDDFAYYLSKFFQSYLNGIRNVSENTIHSYRDTFTKLLVYYRDNCGIAPEKMSFSVFAREHIENFLLVWKTNRNAVFLLVISGLQPLSHFADMCRLSVPIF